jgi:CIC family chloride channel protein
MAGATPLDLRIVGRTFLHAIVVGLVAGLAGAAFFAAVEHLQKLLLEDCAGYVPLRAHGESVAVAAGASVPSFRPWLLVILPALGGLLCGLLTLLAPETRGGGGDAMIDAFHHQGGVIRRRVIWVKALASLCTLGTGGAGGREGPTMQIGGALGSFVGRALRVCARERRILLVAGVAAGISAVFRTPLGAALLAVEVLYRDGFESDALIPAVLASVVSYSIVISIFGPSTLFAHASGFPFVPAHLPLYALLALLCALFASIFASCLHRTQRLFAKLPGPVWLRPAVGGLLLGALCTPVIWEVGVRMNAPGQGFGILGGGYGAVQVAISGSSWLPEGWGAVKLLLVLCVAKLIASSLTIGSGGSAGDFAPSLAIGGLLGGAFGRAAELLLHDPRIDPGAFALIGMGAFYGGVAHVPLAALVLVCELAGNYDLLVPLMLTQGTAFIALRHAGLYTSQLPTQSDSPIYRDTLLRDALRRVRVADLLAPGQSHVRFRKTLTVAEMLRAFADAPEQEVFPVVDDDGKLIGLVSSTVGRQLVEQGKDVAWALAADVMMPPITLRLHDDLRTATKHFLDNGLRELPVVNEQDRIIGYLDERALASVYLHAEARADAAGETLLRGPGAKEQYVAR